MSNIKKVALVVASEGYQPLEYGVPKTILSNNNIKVLTVSDKPTVAIAKDSSTTDVDLTIDQINTLEIDGLFVIGGPGALEHLNTPKLYDLLQQMNILKKPIGAICVSPRILAFARVLTNKKATGWDEDQELAKIFKDYKVEYIQNQNVVIDDNIITAVGPEAAEEFGLAILKIVTS